jgi:hypothetical protein
MALHRDSLNCYLIILLISQKNPNAIFLNKNTHAILYATMLIIQRNKLLILLWEMNFETFALNL